MRVGIESSTGILSSQSNDVVMEHVERETLSEVSLEVRLEEVVTLSEEIPSVVKLDAPQSGKLVRLVFGAERIIGNYRHKDSSNADSTSDNLAVLAGNWIQDGRIGGEHGMVMRRGSRWSGSLNNLFASWVNVYPRTKELERHAVEISDQHHLRVVVPLIPIH